MHKQDRDKQKDDVFRTSNHPLAVAIDLLSGRWKLILLWNIHLGNDRYGLMKRAVPKISDRMLAKQINELERDGFIKKQIFPEIPPRVEYLLTELSTTLVPILQDLVQWARKSHITEHYQALQLKHSKD